MQPCSIDSAQIGKEAEPAQSYGTDGTGRRVTTSTVVYWTLLIMEVFKLGVERYAKNFVQLLH